MQLIGAVQTADLRGQSLTLYRLSCALAGKCFFTEMYEIDSPEPLLGGGNLVLGQDQDHDRSGQLDETQFDSMQSFSGNITGLEIWKVGMQPKDIEAMANCEIPEVSQAERVVSWSPRVWKTKGVAARVVKLDWGSVCQQPVEEIVVSQFAFHTQRIR